MTREQAKEIVINLMYDRFYDVASYGACARYFEKLPQEQQDKEIDKVLKDFDR